MAPIGQNDEECMVKGASFLLYLDASYSYYRGLKRISLAMNRWALGRVLLLGRFYSLIRRHTGGDIRK